MKRSEGHVQGHLPGHLSVVGSPLGVSIEDPKELRTEKEAELGELEPGMAPKAALLRRPAARGAAPPARRKPRRSPKSGAKPPRKRKSPVEEPVLAVNEAEEKWKKGEVVTLSSVPLECLELGQLMVVEEGSHMQAKVQAACLITMVEGTRRGVRIRVDLQGTTNEEVLRAHTSGVAFTLHRCPPECDEMVTEEGLIHCRQARLVKDVMDEPEWISNLKPGRPPVDWGRDELASLRREAGVTPKVPATKVRSSSSSSKKGKAGKEKKEDAKKKKKKKKEKSRSPKRRRRDRSSGDSKKDSKSRKKTCQKDAIKEPKALFEGTGLDPKDRVRRHLRQKAMKLVRKRTSKKEEASGSSSSGSQSGKTDHEELGELFGESVKARLVADRFPGILAMESLVAMRSSLLQEAGETENQVALKPTALLYYRGNLSKKTSGPQGREVLTHCTVVDYLLRGRVAGQIDRSNCDWNALHYSSASRASPPRESTSQLPGGVEKCNPRVLCRQQDEVVVHSPRWPAWKRQGERWEEPGSQGGQGPQRRRQEVKKK